MAIGAAEVDLEILTTAWLEAHCRLAGVPYRRRKGRPAPWPIGAADRRWMYSAIAAALAEIAYAKNPDVPEMEILVAGCDGSAQVTARWAARAGVDRARLYQALVHRGGYCDCEVLLNAASEDDEKLGLVDYKVCALDATWSGLCFARRKPADPPHGRSHP